MKRALVSLVVIAVVGITAFSFSNAFFSDEETSVGNTFQAGAIDLKVDHTYQTYNGQNCEDACTPTGDNLVNNPGFEDPAVGTPQLWDIFPSGTANLDWSVEWVAGQNTSHQSTNRPDLANLEFHRLVSGWQPQAGSQHAELDSDWFGPSVNVNNEPALVRIYQMIPTTPGEKYQLKYYHSYRPGTDASQNTMSLEINDVVAQTINTANGVGQTQTAWTEHTYQFTATAAATKLAFVAGGPADSLGVFLDSVSLYRLECTGQIGSDVCRLWTEKDLTQGDVFWNFADIKPGDRGTNGLSLHVYDNDAWACFEMSGTDNENVRIEPEVTAGDSSEDVGELSNYLKIFLWHDDNNNGLYEPPEDDIYQGPVPATPVGLFEPNTPLVASNTKVIGLAWCIGTQTVDNGTGAITCDGASAGSDAQTDQYLANLIFHAIQTRNNPDFTCASLQ